MQVISLADVAALNVNFEISFIEQCLLRGKYPFRALTGHWKVDDHLVIYLSYEPDIDLMGRWKSLGNKIVLIHAGDEIGKKDLSSYLLSDFILRPYFIKSIFHDPRWSEKIMWIPNGFKYGVGPNQVDLTVPSEERRFIAGFLGWIENPASYLGERVLFSNAIGSCGTDFFFQKTNGFGQGFGSGLYNAITRDFVFAPCPAGNSPETIRLYDTLEQGCIPIVLDHEFVREPKCLNSPDFAVLRDWSELPEFLDIQRHTLAKDVYTLAAWQRRISDWWVFKKFALASRIEDQIKRLIRFAKN